MERDNRSDHENKDEVDQAGQAAERKAHEPVRIYVASLSDYNAGRLHGVWIDAAQDDETVTGEIAAMLRASPEPVAEEWAIHDFEGFGPMRLGEYENLEIVTKVARGITEHGSAYAYWADIVGTSDPDGLDRFEDAYLGHFETREAYADQLLDDMGAFDLVERSVPEFLQPYVKVDVEGFARDLELSGDITTSEGDGGVYIFGRY